MVPILDKDGIKFITKTLNPTETLYVAGVADVIDVVSHDPVIAEENVDDVLYIVKLYAFKTKFDILRNTATNGNYQLAIATIYYQLEGYLESATIYIQSIIGQLTNEMFKELTLPISDNPLEVINELKQCVNNFVELHNDDTEYRGMQTLNNTFIQQIHTAIYNFRLNK